MLCLNVQLPDTQHRAFSGGEERNLSKAGVFESVSITLYDLGYHLGIIITYFPAPNLEKKAHIIELGCCSGLYVCSVSFTLKAFVIKSIPQT